LAIVKILKVFLHYLKTAAGASWMRLPARGGGRTPVCRKSRKAGRFSIRELLSILAASLLVADSFTWGAIGAILFSSSF